jgi:aminomethyltransferase
MNNHHKLLRRRDTLAYENSLSALRPRTGRRHDSDEAGLGFFVLLGKGEFAGRSVLAGQKAKGVQIKLIAHKMAENPRRREPIILFG